MAYIHANLIFLLQSTAKLEKTANLLSKTITEFNDIQDKLNKINCSAADAVNKNSTYPSKNKGFEIVYEISC
jgi:hypothetical protein